METFLECFSYFSSDLHVHRAKTFTGWLLNVYYFFYFIIISFSPKKGNILAQGDEPT